MNQSGVSVEELKTEGGDFGDALKEAEERFDDSNTYIASAEELKNLSTSINNIL
jgi:hypothetical protein